MTPPAPDTLHKGSRIYVAGHRGLAGSALMRTLQARGYRNVIALTHAELDLVDQTAVREFFARERPEHVFIAAAKVGGILANEERPAEFAFENLAIQTNLIHESWRTGVQRLTFLGSSCVYPRDCPQPIREEYLLTGPLESTNRAYAVAKIAGIEMCASYNRQYGTHYVCAMPTNLLGPGDNYDLHNSHVVPALIRKAHEAKSAGDPAIVLWGTGAPRRELLHSDDLAAACVLLHETEWERVATLFANPRLPLLNVGTGDDNTIRDLAGMVCRIVGFEGAVVWDASRPDGTPRKVLDVGRMHSTGWRARISLEEGIASAYADFLARAGKERSTP